MESPEEIVHRVVILTALPLEYAAARAFVVSPDEIVHPKGTVYEQGIYQGKHHQWSVLLAEVGTGNNLSALETERAIGFFDPKVVIFVGIAGGLKDLDFGDVVVADKAYYYEGGKATDKRMLTRPELGKSTYGILERAKAEVRSENWTRDLSFAPNVDRLPKAVVKPIAAGEKVVVGSASFVSKLIKNSYNDAVAVEMEGYGFFAACGANPGLECLIVRGISDKLDNKSTTDGLGYQDIAARNASTLAFSVLHNFRIN